MARILVIDDDEAVRTVVKQMLEDAGHVVTLAVDGDDGLRQFRQETIDLVVLDVFMPKKSGIAALKELLILDARVPVIVMSGGAPNPAAAEAPAVDHRELALLLGAADTIAKPFRAAELGAIVQRHLAPRS